MAGEDLKRLWEQFLQLELIDSHEEAGNLTAKTARGYRLHGRHDAIGCRLDGDRVHFVPVVRREDPVESGHRATRYRRARTGREPG